MAEAAAQFQRGLDQLKLRPDDTERQRQELEFCSALGAALMAVKGYAAPETGQAYGRARELWEQLGSPPGFLRIPYGQSLYHVARGELDLAQRLDEDLLRVSHQRNDSAGLVLGHLSAGRNLMLAGSFARSRSHLEEAYALCDRISYGSLLHQVGYHLQVLSQAWLGLDLFCLGFPDQAVARSSAAIAEARELAHPPSLAVSLALGARLLSLVGDDVALDQRVAQLVAVATEHGLPHWRAQGTIARGWVKVRSGDVAEGMSLLRSGSTAYRATGAKSMMPQFIALLAAACDIAGQIAEALSLLDEALQIVGISGERWPTAELHRQKGDLLQRQGHDQAAEELYREALSIAEAQGARLWELRAAASLARLWRDQGKHAAAYDILGPVYGWFSEGFGTPDLREARALIDELEGA
jgi:predicted ATPase